AHGMRGPGVLRDAPRVVPSDCASRHGIEAPELNADSSIPADGTINYRNVVGAGDPDARIDRGDAVAHLGAVRRIEAGAIATGFAIVDNGPIAHCQPDAADVARQPQLFREVPRGIRARAARAPA